MNYAHCKCQHTVCYIYYQFKFVKITSFQPFPVHAHVQGSRIGNGEAPVTLVELHGRAAGVQYHPVERSRGNSPPRNQHLSFGHQTRHGDDSAAGNYLQEC